MPQVNCIQLWQQEYLSSFHAPDTRAWGFTSRCRIQPDFTFFIKRRHTSFVPLSVFAFNAGCYRPYSLHLPWCQATGVGLTGLKPKLLSSPQGHQTVPSPLGAKHRFSLCWERGWPFPVSQHGTMPPLCPRVIDHLQAVIHNILHSTTRAFSFSDPKTVKTHLSVWPFASQQIWVVSATVCSTPQ